MSKSGSKHHAAVLEKAWLEVLGKADAVPDGPERCELWQAVATCNIELTKALERYRRQKAKPPQPTSGERRYVLRRIVYDCLLAAQALKALSQETMKATALLMARNLNEFLFLGHKEATDARASDFDLGGWCPSAEAELTSDTIGRINTLFGHVVRAKPEPFRDRRQVRRMVAPLIREGCCFVCQCRATNQARYHGNARKYVEQLNPMLKDLGIPPLPTS